MKPILIVFATREGQAGKVARYVADTFRHEGFEADLLNAAEVPQSLRMADYRAAVLVASIHVGSHEKEMVRFVTTHREELRSMLTGFLSVSGSQAGAERTSAPEDVRERCARDARTMINRFIKETGWQPTHTLPVAGALMYRKYNFLVRLIMRRIAKREGGSTDMSNNTEYTDWKTLGEFVERFCDDLNSAIRLRVAS